MSHIDIADMNEQVRQREARLTVGSAPGAVCGALAVVTGAGFMELFSGLGVAVLDGGPT